MCKKMQTIFFFILLHKMRGEKRMALTLIIIMIMLMMLMLLLLSLSPRIVSFSSPFHPRSSSG